MRDLSSERGGARTSKLNQWLKRPLLFDRSIEGGRFQRKIKGLMVYIVYIVYIVSMLYAPELHRGEVSVNFFL